MTILGYIVSNNQNMSEINFNNVVGRIRSQIQLWSKFRLSLPGRITIAKTFLLSFQLYDTIQYKYDINFKTRNRNSHKIQFEN